MRHMPLTILLAALCIASPLFAQTTAPKEPLLEADRVMADFMRENGSMPEYYRVAMFTLRGRVKDVSTAKTPKGDLIATVMLLPLRDSPTMIPLQVNLGGKGAEAAAKAKPGDIVDISHVMFTELPLPPEIHEFSLFSGESLQILPKSDAPASPSAAQRDALLAWLKKGNAVPPDEPFVPEMMKLADAALAANKDFKITFGASLMKSAKPTEIGIINGKFYNLTLTDEQAQQMKLAADTVAHIAIRTDTTIVPPEITLGQPAIDGGNTWDLHKPLTGKIHAAILGKQRIDQIQAHYALRIVTFVGDTRLELQVHAAQFAEALPFKFELTPEDFKRFKLAHVNGPHAVFFEWVRATQVQDTLYLLELLGEPRVVTLNLKSE